MHFLKIIFPGKGSLVLSLHKELIICCTSYNKIIKSAKMNKELELENGFCVEHD